jgi:4-hydroxybenzoate polyprenyltransferase
MVAQFIHEVVDLKEDRKRRIITTAVFLGEKNIRRLCCIFLFLSLLFSFLLYHDGFVNLLFMIVTSFFVLLFVFKISVFGISKELRREYKCLGILVGLIFFMLLW